MDLAIIETDEGDKIALIECNEGYSLGKYEGLSDQDYTDLLISRWKSII